MLPDKKLKLRERIIEMSALVETMIEKAIRGLETQNQELLQEVVERHEPLVNQLEVAIDEYCTSLIALHEPRAGDLRLVLTAFKMAGELERIGDHAVNVAQSSLFLIARPAVKPLIDIPRMGRMVVEMLQEAIRSFIREDTALAHEVLERDDQVDALRDQILRELITYMAAEPATIERAVHLIRISQNLERVADMATNISEEIIYLVQGRVVKHHLEEGPEV